MVGRCGVFVYGSDPISQAGVASQLRGRPRISVVEERHIDDADVAVVVVDEIDESTVRTVRGIQRDHCPSIVLVATNVDDAALLQAVECGARAVLRRSEATPERLSKAVEYAERGDGEMAPDLLGKLLEQMSRLQRDVLAPRGLGPQGLSEREVEVLRHLSEGSDTAEIAEAMSYSERTIKNIIHEVTSRLQLRNRSHAVAYAMKAGII
ncbi:MAG: response regulator transcription factor [Ilumatobacter sp.]|uniref:helix-turn-helix transcriptional regulator n=1 Tax=Ilumatobacter sp. TaxID=1967498 RepID=UPI002631AAEE|nr:response regulator transcription factor [Ilumatobacter sp.]MDJ0770591.1 response regulator transcription factor [Ilumatobacter sp.]